MIDKTIAFIVLILAAILNLPTLFKAIIAAYQIKKEYEKSKEEEKDERTN